MNIFPGTEIRSETDLQKILAANRLRVVYEDMIMRATGRTATYPVTGIRKRVKKNLKLFGEISRHLGVLGVSPEVFMTVLFQKPKGAEFWKYPYLEWLSSNRALEVFKYRYAQMHSHYGKSLGTILNSTKGDNFDVKFEDAFTGGFYALDRTKRGSPVGFLTKLENLFATFLAYADIFKPEFVATSFYLEPFLEVNRKTREGIIITEAVERYMLPVLDRGRIRKRYFELLFVARERVSGAEEKILRKKNELTDTKGKEIWKMLR